MDVVERNGPRGGAYYLVNLSDGRQLVVSRKPGDPRVWLGRPEEKASWQGQRGGIGKIDKLLDEWFAEIESNPEARELYGALSALRDAPGAVTVCDSNEISPRGGKAGSA